MAGFLSERFHSDTEKKSLIISCYVISVKENNQMLN